MSKKRSFSRINSAYNGQMPAAVVGAIVGMIAGALPALIIALIFRVNAYVLYAACPLAMCGLILLLKGCRDIRAFILMAAMSLPGAYLTHVSAEAAIYAAEFDMPLLSVPLVALSSIGRAELLPGTVAGYMLPLMFTALGWLLSCRLLAVSEK